MIGALKKYRSQLVWKGLYSIFLAGGYIALSMVRYFVSINQGQSILYNVVSKACQTYVADITSLPNVLLAGLVFHFFISLKPRENRIINGLVRGTFSVYIIHQVPAFYYFFLWTVLFKAESWLSEHHVLYVAIVVITVFAACSMIDIPRRKVLEPIYEKTKLFNLVSQKIERLYK